MTASACFIDFAGRTFQFLGAISARREFGGAYVFCKMEIIPVTDDHVYYLKADQASGNEFNATQRKPIIGPPHAKAPISSTAQNKKRIIFGSDTSAKLVHSISIE